MMPANTRLDSGVWSVPGHSCVIEYSRPVLNEILIQVVNAYDTYLAGGFEVGGVLFGNHEGGTVRILAFRQLQIVPPRPSFVLSKSDGQHFEQLINLPQSDKELRGMVAVGWYHSHTRSDVFLSESDLEIYDTHFRQPWQIAMVLHPSDLEPVRIGFFFREADGFIRTDQSYQEFAMDTPPRVATLRKQPPWEITFDGRVKEPPLPEVDPEEYALPPEPERPAWWRRAGSFLVMLVVVLSAVGAAAWSIVWLRQSDPPLGLKLDPSQGELNIVWSAASPSIQSADEGILFILDGGQRKDIPLAKPQLLHPGQTYKPRTSRVDVRFKIKGSWGRSQEEVATYLVHPDRGKPSPELLQARKEQADAEKDVLELRQLMAETLRQTETVTTEIAELERRRLELLEARKPKKLVLPAAPKPGPAKELPTAPDLAMRNAAPVPQLTQSQVPLRPPAEPPKPTPVSPTPLPVRPPVAATPAPTPVPIPKPAVQASGRFIWTGDLPKDQPLTINGRKASRGFVNGELPGLAVQVGAYPAELTNDGLKVFTGNPTYAAGRVEPASAANGWQKTQYVYDPKTMRDLIVEQMPGPQNYKQMVIRAGSKRLSLIVIDWQAVTQ